MQSQNDIPPQNVSFIYALYKTKPPLLPKPCMSSEAGSPEHAVPQMIITSAEEVSQEIQNAQETSSVSTSPYPENTEVNIHAEKEVEKDVEIKQEPNIDEPIKNVEISEEPTTLSESKVDSKSSESISHSVIQRPLVIESEKSVPLPSDTSAETDSKCSSPVPSVASVLTAVQRPLVFDGSAVAHTDTSSRHSLEQDIAASSSVTFDLSESPTAFKSHASELEEPDVSESCDSPTFIELKPKSASFSWLPSFPKLHASSKESRPSSSQDVCDRNKISEREQKETDEVFRVKKEKRLQNMKTFFDSFLHDTDEEAKARSKMRPESFVEPGTSAQKEKKHGLKRFFSHPSKLDAAADEKNVSRTSESHIENLELKQSSPQHKSNMKKFFDSIKFELTDANLKSEEQKPHSSGVGEPSADVSKAQHKHGIKKFFDSFKHDASEDKLSSSKLPGSQETALSTNDTADASFVCIDPVLPKAKEEIKDVSDIPHKDSKLETSNVCDLSNHDSAQNAGYFIPKSYDHYGSAKVTEVKGDLLPSKQTNVSEIQEKVLTLEQTESSGPSVQKQEDSKQSLKNVLSTFRHQTVEESISSNNLFETRGTLKTSLSDTDLKNLEHKETSTSDAKPKESKHGIKKFFSFKHSTDSKCPKMTAKTVVHTNVQSEHEINASNEPFENIKNDEEKMSKTDEQAVSDTSAKEKHKESKTGLKKVFDSFRHTDTKKETQADKNEMSSQEQKLPGIELKVTTDTNADEDNTKKKDIPHGKKKFFESFKTEGHKSDKNKAGNQGEKSLKHPESATEKEGLSIGSVKTFFDTLGQKSTSKVSSHSQAQNPEYDKQNEHIYDIVGAPTTSVSTDKPQPVQPGSKKAPEGGHGMKKMFDSFMHKDSKLDNKENVEECKGVSKKDISGEILKKDEGMVSPDKGKEHQKNYFQGMKKIFDSFTHKDGHEEVTKSVETSVPTVKISESGADDVEASGNQENTLKTKENHSSVEDALKPTHGSYIQDNFSEQSIRQKGDVMSPDAKKLAENEHQTHKPAETKELSDTTSTKHKEKIEPGTPETLYDTCCIRIASLLRDKAIEIVTDKSKKPPAKPPKPSAEAIAKARANAVSRRLKELQNKDQSLGENISAGLDGIRFADDETESSCDYHDVENIDYIIDYELINRYKSDNKLDTFSVPSASSVTSVYYTPDTMTLQDENFSDAALETVSLRSDSCLKRLSPSPVKTDHIHPCRSDIKDGMHRTGSVSPCLGNKAALEQSPSSVKSRSSSQTTGKKVPPPLPPKPVFSPKQTSAKPNDSEPGEDSSSTRYINGLSLSPRLQAKTVKDSAKTQKRPLMVAGIKETEFNLSVAKSKDVQKKPLKDRKFETVLKNDSLKNAPNVSPHPKLSSTKSSPANVSPSTLIRKISPPRPPPPQFPLHREGKPQETESSVVTQKEKRTISPPRPPPPVFAKKTPPRPPPPAVPTKPARIMKQHQCSRKKVEDGSCPFCAKGTSEKKEAVADETNPVSKDGTTANSSEVEETVTQTNFRSSEVQDNMNEVSLDSTAENKESYVCVDSSEHKEQLDIHEHSSKIELSVVVNADLSETKESISVAETSGDVNVETSENEKVMEQEVAAMNLENASVVLDVSKSEETASISTPKPPPRTRRVRSRTVEIVPVDKSEPRLRRSQSLSDIEVEKRVELLPPNKSELKSLYTTVNKDAKKSNGPVHSEAGSPNLEKVSSRPLPAPPPPPRKFRSLERPTKQNKDKTRIHTVEAEVHIMPETELVNDIDLKPPVRKKKSEKRFHSLGSEVRQKSRDDICQNSKIGRSSSVPLRPERKLKHSPRIVDENYDENANITGPVVSEMQTPLLDECGNEILDSNVFENIPQADVVDSPRVQSHPQRTVSHREGKQGTKKKSSSSWYDEKQSFDDSWEVVDWSHTDDIESKLGQPRMPLRRRSDPGKKVRTSSKFYVDVDIEPEKEHPPLVDKETSPLPLDCSEKSVQTSLETLSQGIASRGEESEDTDELLDLAQTLQNELKVIINRHRPLSDVDDESNTPPASATDSEKNFDHLRAKAKKAPSIQSSTSEIWPMSSSEESDGETGHDAASNLTEFAMTRKQKKIFYIAQEIMTSEEVFVDALKLLNVDFKAFVDSANKQRNITVIPEEVLSQILNHLPQLQHLNENLLSELKDRIENWNKTEKIADVIVKMGPFLKLYSWYIHDFESNVALLEESKRKYPAFAQVVKEFEMSERCKKLTLNHYMLKPIQRIPQYRLLLQEYLHHLSEDFADYQDTLTALQIVSEVANHANESMKQGDNAQKLICLQNSILGHKEIVKPGRVFLKEGELMKLSRKGMQPRWFVLFNDLLLYLTPVQQGLFRINHELPLTGMKVAIPIQQDYQNEFSIISVTRSFTLAARSQEERQEWIIALTKAIEENASKRSTFTNIRLQQKASQDKTEEDESSFVLGKKAPVWIPDSRVTMCQLCTSEFTVTFRRHHCRACGKVVCSICSSNRISLPYLGNRIARVCDECHSRLGPGTSGCTESGETDSDNQQIALKPHLRTEHRHTKKAKRNLPSVLKEVCANDQGSMISGYLQRKTGKSWKKDWFVVKDKVLYEYRASEDVAALRSIPLLGYNIETFTEPYENIDSSLVFQLTHPGQLPIIFHADTVGAAERWVAALKEASVLE